MLSHNRLILRSLISNKAVAARIVVSQTQARNFSIEEIGKRYSKPYDYLNKKYGLLGQMFDSTLDKLGENSLIVTVDGNFGAGKTEFAKALAERCDFVYAREPDLEHHVYTLSNGNNIRDIINEKVGDHPQFYIDSLNEWHANPTFRSTIFLQNLFYNIRWMQTRNALLHLFSTGQGVVLERSAFSDRVIAEALYENNFMSEEAWKFYIKDLVPMTVPELWKPHVQIYIDKSPEECLKTIRSKETNKSKVYSIEFLTSMDRLYKEFNKRIQSDLHCLTVKSSEANVERTIEDMEMLNFDDETKFSDWRIRKEMHINVYRRRIANLKHAKDVLHSPDSYVSVPEYLLYGEDAVKLRNELEEDPRLGEDPNSVGMFSMLKQQKEKSWF